MKTVAIFIADSNGGYPVPATKGGAVATLVEHLIKQNSIDGMVLFKIISFYSKEAFEISKKYNNVEFIWVKIPKFISLFDEIFFKFIKKVFKKKKAMSYKSFFSLLYYIKKSIHILKKNEFDKVVLENNIPLALIIKKSKYKGEYFYHFHNIPRINVGCKEVFKNCKKILCVSKYVANEIISENNSIGPINKESVKILYNCIDFDKFYPIKNDIKLEEYRNRFGINNDDNVILFVGRLSMEKGIDQLIEAVKLIKNIKYKVLITGSYIHNDSSMDEYQKKLLKDAKELGDKIIFTGYIQQSDLVYIYNMADVAVLPSMWEEPAGLTMLEAIACGTKVITTNSGGIPEYVARQAIILDRDKDLIYNISKEIDKILQKKDVVSESDIKKNIEYLKNEYSCNNYLKRFIGLI